MILEIFIMYIDITQHNMMLMGLILIGISIDSMIIYKECKNLFLLLTILSITNICIVYGCFWFYEDNAYNWQIPLAGTKPAIITAKVFAIFYISMMIVILLSYKPQISSVSFNHLIKCKNWTLHKFTFIFLYLFLYYILIFCFNRSVSEYTTGSSALYEYAIVFFIFLWIYMPQGYKYRILMVFYASLYILQGLLFGDRSSALPLMIVLYILISKSVTPIKFVGLSIFGIFGANLIGIYRKTFTISNDIISEVLNRLLYVDSIVYSYYTGVQITRAIDSIHNKFEHFIEWSISLFLGNSGKLSISELIIKNGFHNTGGGLSSSYFYFWGDLIGVIIGGGFIGFLLGKIFSSNKSYCPVLQVVILAFSLRWYSYFPNVFFRTCIIVPFVLYYIMKIFGGQQNKLQTIK